MKKPKWMVPAALCLVMVLVLQWGFLGHTAPWPETQRPLDVQAAPASAEADPAVDLGLPCRAALLMDQTTGTVLYEKNADTRMPVASITKLMTLLLTFEAVHDGKLTMDTKVPTTPHAASMGGSQIWLEPGEEFTLDEMIKAICVSSANDAAVAVAELVAGSEPAFVSRMNARAAELGMENTQYCNACGLDQQGHLSTARDVATLSRYILTTCPEVLHYTGIWTDNLRGGQTQLVNTNKLLRRYPGITGLKTGTTGGAGVCISATATRDDLSLIAVILGSDSGKERFEAAQTLLDYGFANYEAGPLPEMGDVPLLLPVRGAAQGMVPLDYTDLPGQVLLKKGEAKSLRAEWTLPDQVQAPVQSGQALGQVELYAGERKLGTWPIKSALEMARLDWETALKLILEKMVKD